MKLKKKLLTLLSCVSLILYSTSLFAIEHSDLVGSWSGELKAGIQVFPLVFNITSPNDELKATLDSPNQGAMGIPVSEISIEKSKIVFVINAAQAEFIANLTDDKQNLNGIWKQGPNELPLSLTKVQVVKSTDTITRPQEPKKPYGYKEEIVTFTNSEANIKLAGTLTTPLHGSNFPAVVLITGSGPQDRNQTFMGHKTFWVLSDYLTKNGVAVLRYDDRGVGKSEGKFETSNSLDFAHDASAAVDFLATQKNIDTSAIGLIGHSEGGLIAPITADLNSKVGYIVSLAGPSLTGNEIAITQIKDTLLSIGLDTDTANFGAQITAQLNQTVLNNKDNTLLKDELLASYQKAWNAIPKLSKDKLMAIGGGQLSDARLQQLSSNWTKYFLKHDPKIYLSKLKVPTLVLYGSKDTQLNPITNIPVFEDLLVGNNSFNEIHVMEDLNHLFQPAKTGLMDEYVSIQTTFSPLALNKIAVWIKRVSE